jgi:amino-acid N-acetyltransferase
LEHKSDALSKISGRPGRAAAVALLEAAGLPTEDLADEKLEHFFLAGDRAAPAGLVGLELFGRVALLRSLVVAAAARTTGIGTKLVAHVEAFAASRGVRSIYLLTTTAEAFFAARGYSRVERSTAPGPIRSTREFADLCPSSSAFMVKQLEKETDLSSEQDEADTPKHIRTAK